MAKKKSDDRKQRKAKKSAAQKRTQRKGLTRAKSVETVSASPPLEQRLRQLEVHVAALQEMTGFQLDADEDQEPITFTLNAGGPPVVRLTLDGTEMILLDSSTKQSRPRKNGVPVSVFMEVWGSPGQQANISVGNAIPTSITSSVLTSGHGTDVRSVRTNF